MIGGVGSEIALLSWRCAGLDHLRQHPFERGNKTGTVALEGHAQGGRIRAVWRHSQMSTTSRPDSVKTAAPFCATIRTRPSVFICRNASRTGVLDTPKRRRDCVLRAAGKRQFARDDQLAQLPATDSVREGGRLIGRIDEVLATCGRPSRPVASGPPNGSASYSTKSAPAINRPDRLRSGRIRRAGPRRSCPWRPTGGCSPRSRSACSAASVRISSALSSGTTANPDRVGDDEIAGPDHHAAAGDGNVDREFLLAAGKHRVGAARGDCPRTDRPTDGLELVDVAAGAVDHHAPDARGSSPVRHQAAADRGLGVTAGGQRRSCRRLAHFQGLERIDKIALGQLHGDGLAHGLGLEGRLDGRGHHAVR